MGSEREDGRRREVMNGFDLNIEEIRIIIRKREKGVFDFSTPGRKEDGFVFFTDGDGTFFDGDRREYPVSAGTLVLLRKGEPYRFFCPPGCEYVTSACAFSPVSEETLKRLPRTAVCTPEETGRILETERLWQSQREDALLACRIGLLDLYRMLLSHAPFSAQDPARRIAARAAEYLHDHFRQPLSVGQIAAYCAVSPSHLRAVFRACTGSSLVEFRSRLRLEAAKQMLSSGLFSVKETAAELGYCDVSYFSKCFTRQVGVPPAQFARRHGEQ